MSIERSIVRRLYESKKIYEAEFESGGSTYSCAFGKYYKDGEQISRDDYFKAKGDNSDTKTSSSDKSTTKMSIQDIIDAPYSGDDRAQIKINGETYIKVDKDVWEHQPKDGSKGKSYYNSTIYNKMDNGNTVFDGYTDEEFDDALNDIESDLESLLSDWKSTPYEDRNISEIDDMREKLDTMEDYLSIDQYDKLEALRDKMRNADEVEYVEEEPDDDDYYKDRY